MPSRPSIHDFPTTAVGATTRSSPVYRIRLHALAKLKDGIPAVLIAFLAQLLIAGIQCMLHEVNFPPSILAMAGVFVALSVLGWMITGVEDFYQKRIKPAADLLNRHMSIGFTIPFIMICRSPFADARAVGVVVLCFAVTGIFNTVFAYALALSIQYLMVRWDKTFWVAEEPSDMERAEGQCASIIRTPVTSYCEGSSTDSSPAISIYLPGGESSSGDGPSPPPSPSLCLERLASPLRARLLDWVLHNPILLLCWLFTVAIGLPLRYVTQNSTPLATFLLFSTWLTTLALQTGIKSHPLLSPWLRTLLSGLSNPVLWTSLAMTSYLVVDGALSNRPLHDMLDTLQTHTPLSSLILARSTSPPSAQPPAPNTTTAYMGAGDVATSILDAGLVAWGLKLYEHRGRLASRAGGTVVWVSATAALGNVAWGPRVARAAGVAPGGRALAFAARSVTIALGGPAMAALGGDAGLNAAMVVVSGIAFQMALGFGVGAWLEGAVLRSCWKGMRMGMRTAPPRVGSDAAAEASGPERESAGSARQQANDPRVVAAGVTVGINAAAMGTAYLYEAQSEAAPHAALSMMALGIMTAVYSTITPLARWVAESVAV
ncbi:hypothetical protein MFIFM68171_10171 [Madurella fahalii]|uniref:LrgB-like protein n=1 Tax=Madurella fahalii TaxID=1157608 RepID=A0ABQ0GQG1_9PEZI